MLIMKALEGVYQSSIVIQVYICLRAALLLLTSLLLLPPQLGVLRPQVPDLVLVRTERAKVRDITQHLELHLILP